jgi:multidrug efflux system membrane fusion protein
MATSRIRVLGPVAILALLVIGGVVWMLGARTERAAKGAASGTRPSVPVVVCTVQQQDVPIYRYGIGTVRALNTVKVVPRIAGELIAVLFSEGQEVRVGDELARIDPASYEATRRQVQANLARDEARLSSAAPELARIKELQSRGIAPLKLAEEQAAVVEQLKAEIAADKALLDKANIDVGYTIIRAPIAGRIGLRAVDVGNFVLAGDMTVITTINQVKPITVIFSLPDIDLLPVTEQLAAGRTLAVSALSRDNQTELEVGKLLTLDNQVDAKTGTFKLKAVFDNIQGRLWPGQFVNARLHLDTQRAGTVIPAQAVQRGPNGTYVFTVAANGTAEMRPAVSMQIENGVALISTGVQPGEKVVVDGQYRLEPGDVVTELVAAQFTGARATGGDPCAPSKPPAS